MGIQFAATARLMVAAGAKVAIGDILDETGRKLAQEIGALYIHLDVTSEASWVEALDATVKAYGKLDVLVNNAGIFNGKGVEEASLDDWHKLVAVNLTGVVLGTRAALPHLKKTKGCIVNLASIAGLVGSQLDPLYSLTKGGVTLFTKSTALEFGRKGYGIRVNSIHPGVIETDMGQKTFVMRAAQVGTNDTEQARKTTLGLHPIGRLGVAEDIAKGIVFLASDDASFMTGAGLKKWAPITRSGRRVAEATEPLAEGRRHPGPGGGDDDQHGDEGPCQRGHRHHGRGLRGRHELTGGR